MKKDREKKVLLIKEKFWKVKNWKESKWIEQLTVCVTFLAITDSEMFENGLLTVQPEAEHSVHLPTNRLFGIVPAPAALPAIVTLLLPLFPLTLVKRPLPFPFSASSVPLPVVPVAEGMPRMVGSFLEDEVSSREVAEWAVGGSNSVPRATWWENFRRRSSEDRQKPSLESVSGLVFERFFGSMIRYVLMECCARYELRECPFPGSTSNRLSSRFNVSSVICTRLLGRDKSVLVSEWVSRWVSRWASTYPGTPPDSIWLARVTSSLQTSYCHFRRPITPHRTFPLWTPILMSTFTCVASLTALFVRFFRP